MQSKTSQATHRSIRRNLPALFVMLAVPFVVLGQGRPDIAWIQAGHRGSVDGAFFAPDGRTAFSHDLFTLKIWRTSDGTLLRTIQNSFLRQVVLSRDGQWLATQDHSSVALLRVDDGARLWARGDANGISAIAFSPDGDTIVSAGGQFGIAALKFFRVSDGRLLRTIETGDDPYNVVSLAFSPDGEVLVSGSTARTIKFWRASDGTHIRTISDARYENIRFSPDGKLVASTGYGRTIKLWRASDGTLVRTLEYVGSPNDLAFSADGTVLAAGVTSSGKGVVLFRVADGSVIARIEEDDYARGVDLSPDGTTVLIGLRTGVSHRRLPDGKTLWRVGGRVGHALACSPDGQILAAPLYATPLMLWRASDGALLETLDNVRGLTTIAFSPDSELLAVAEHDNGITLRRLPGGLVVHALPGHARGINGLSFSPDGRLLVSASRDGSAKLWRVDDGSLLRTHEESTGIPAAAFSPDGGTLALRLNRSIKLFRVADGRLVREIQTGPSGQTVAFSPDGRLVAAPDMYDVRIWNVSTGELVHTLRGHYGPVTWCRFSPDGRFLASIDQSHGTVRFWRVSDGTLLQTFDEETVQAHRICFLQDGARFAYTRFDDTLVVANTTVCDPCDANCDGDINTFDIEPFLDLLFNGGEPCDPCTGDINGDGAVDAGDIEGFINCLFP